VRHSLAVLGVVLTSLGGAQACGIPLETEKLIQAVVTSPSGRSFPERPSLPLAVKMGVARELTANAKLKSAYEKLDAKKSNREWFEGIRELAEAKAVWCLATALCHPHDDVQIRSAQALARLGDPKPARFMLTVAKAFAVWESGSENATLHGIFQHELANALNKLTNTSVTLGDGQDPEGLNAGLAIWQQALDEGPPK
jgi:hypothetical protein